MIFKGDVIITAYAESRYGPGSHIKEIWLIVENPQGEIRKERLEEKYRSKVLELLYPVSEAVHLAMLHEVVNIFLFQRKG